MDLDPTLLIVSTTIPLCFNDFKKCRIPRETFFLKSLLISFVDIEIMEKFVRLWICEIMEEIMFSPIFYRLFHILFIFPSMATDTRRQDALVSKNSFQKMLKKYCLQLRQYFFWGICDCLLELSGICWIRFLKVLFWIYFRINEAFLNFSWNEFNWGFCFFDINDSFSQKNVLNNLYNLRYQHKNFNKRLFCALNFNASENVNQNTSQDMKPFNALT